MRQGKWSEALEMLGEANPFRGTGEIFTFTCVNSVPF